MIEFLVGLFIMLVGLTGNAGYLLEELSQDGSFLPFAVALGILYALWQETPEPERTPVRALIVALLAAAAVSQSSRLISGVKIAWAALQSLSFSNQNNLSSGVSTVPEYDNGLDGNPAWDFSGNGSDNESKTSFLQSIFPAAKNTAQALNVPVSAILGQAALETGYGTSNVYNTDNNAFGINVAGAATGENYQYYPSPTASVSALQSLVQSQYPNAIGSSTALQYGQALQNGGYATDPNYAVSLANTANSSTIQNFLAPYGLR